MSTLTDDPKLMQEVISILVRRLGGSVEISAEDSFALGAYSLLSKFDREAGKLWIVFEQDAATASPSGETVRGPGKPLKPSDQATLSNLERPHG